MKKLETRLPKGFRDYASGDAQKREFLIGKIKETFNLFGFEALETPIVEYAQTLKGKYGDEEKLIYEFLDRGGRMVALRFDQTVPLARFVAQNPQLAMPYRRYSIGPVFRAENPQKGRYRQFLQCDVDIVGAQSVLADIEILNLALAVYKNLGLKVTVKVNDRTSFEGISQRYVTSIDKIEKIGRKGVLDELKTKGLNKEEGKKLLDSLLKKPPTARLVKIIKSIGSAQIKFDPLLARGLNYYTGLIFEVVTKESASSICGGGRFDNLIGMFAGKSIPAVGFAIGFDRTLEAMTEKNLIPENKAPSQVLVTVFDEGHQTYSMGIVSKLRQAGVPSEIYLDEDRLEKQIRYASRQKIPFVAIAGPNEAKENKVTIKDLRTGDQSTIRISEAANLVKR